MSTLLWAIDFMALLVHTYTSAPYWICSKLCYTMWPCNGKSPIQSHFLSRAMSTSTSEQSGPISMSTMISNIMWLIKDDEITVSSEYVEQIMELFCLSIGEIWCIQRSKFDLIQGARDNLGILLNLISEQYSSIEASGTLSSGLVRFPLLCSF